MNNINTTTATFLYISIFRKDFYPEHEGNRSFWNVNTHLQD